MQSVNNKRTKSCPCDIHDGSLLRLQARVQDVVLHAGSAGVLCRMQGFARVLSRMQVLPGSLVVRRICQGLVLHAGSAR